MNIRNRPCNSVQINQIREALAGPRLPFGLFRWCVEAQIQTVKIEMVEKQEGQKLTGWMSERDSSYGDDFRWFCCDANACLCQWCSRCWKDCRIKRYLATRDSVVLGTTQDHQDAASLSLSTNQSQSLSEFNSQSASQSASTSQSISASNSSSVSQSMSQSASTSQSLANSQSVTASSSESPWDTKSSE